MRRRWRGEGASSARPLVLPAGQVRAIARREKTQLRRLAVADMSDGSAGGYRQCGLEEGSSFRVQPAADRQLAESDPVARIVVTGVWLQVLRDVSLADARAEGHRSMADFADWWLRLHLRDWPPREPKLCGNCAGWAQFTDHHGEVVPCTLCDYGEVMGDQAVDDAVKVAALRETQGHRRVWVVAFELSDRRFMHRDSQKGYTSDPREAMPGEPEVLPAPRRDWAARAEQRRRRDAADVDALRLSGLSTFEERMAEMRRMAAERGVDLTREQAVIDERLGRMRRRIGRADAA